MTKFIEEKILEWADSECRKTNIKLQYLDKRLFSTYKRSQSPHPNFWNRMVDWIQNANGHSLTEVELFKSINSIFYIGPKELDELYRSAYDTIIARWLIDLRGISIVHKDAQKLLIDSVRTTWFCPTSDSFLINSFYHLNNIPGEADIRPEWRGLQKLGDVAKIREYIANNNIGQIVILEDFVGGGSQIFDAANFLAQFKDVVDILVVPLIICPNGVDTIGRLCASIGVDFLPVLPLPQNTFVKIAVDPDESHEYGVLRNLANDTFAQVSNGLAPGAQDPSGKPIKPYYPLGWEETGGLVVMFTNTPDNTLPMFHFLSPDWKPIFPRHSRN